MLRNVRALARVTGRKSKQQETGVHLESTIVYSYCIGARSNWNWCTEAFHNFVFSTLKINP
jgi:hypothetical protein